MSELFPDCKRLKKLVEQRIAELESQGIKIFNSVADMDAGIPDITVHSKAVTILKYPTILKALTETGSSELEHFIQTAELPADIGERLKKYEMPAGSDK